MKTILDQPFYRERPSVARRTDPSPAYNVQFATDSESQLIVGVDVITSGSDAGQMAPTVGQVEDRSGVTPREWLVDDGFAQHDQIESVSDRERGCTVYAPVPKPKDTKVDRQALKPGDGPAVAAWRQRMTTDVRGQGDLQGAGVDGGMHQRINVGAQIDIARGARLGQGRGDRVVACAGSQPAPRGQLRAAASQVA